MKTIRALLLGALFAFAATAGAQDTVTTKIPFPPLPEFVPSYFGPVRVLRTPFPIDCGPVEPGNIVLGCWTAEGRKLEVMAGLPPERAWWVLEHERMHMIIHDAGIHMPLQVEQDIADAVASSRVLGRLVGNP